MSKFVTMVRDMFATSEAARIEEFDQKFKQREDIIRYADLIYGGNPKWNVLDLYRPKDHEGTSLPIIISVHGGGWIHGDKEGYQYYCMSLASKGYAVINFTYRLAPEYHFPAPIEDLNDVVKWVFEHAIAYQLDTNQIYAVGDSAGAHTLRAYATICTDDEYAKNFSFEVPKKNVFKAIALNSGVYYSNSQEKTSDLIRRLVYEYLGFENNEYQQSYDGIVKVFEYSNYVNSQFPSVFVMTAQEDFVKVHSARFVQQLVEQNVNFELRMYVSKERKLEHIFNCDLRLEEAEECTKDKINFFEKIS